MHKILHFDFNAMLRLIRLDKPTGLVLLLCPSLFAINVASPAIGIDVVILFLKFTLGAFFMRSAGCIINDYFDQDFDKNVSRTKTRPLASGELSGKQGLIFAALLGFCALVILLTMSEKSIIFGLFTVIPVCLYPLMKRFTFFPQIFLGLTFNLGILLAFLEIHDHFSFNSWLIYIGFCFWTISYDTIYALQDIEDDKKIGVKSMAIVLGKSVYNVTEFLNLCFILILLVAGINSSYGAFYILGVLFIFAVLKWQQTILAKNEPDCAAEVFKLNNLIALILVLMSVRF